LHFLENKWSFLLELLAELNQSSSEAVNISRKEMKMLKKVIGNLEHDLLAEKTKYQRALQKKQKQIDQLSTGT
jgi:hypothetical protein